MNTDPAGRGLFLVDNSVSGWTGLRYLEESSSIARALDVADVGDDVQIDDAPVALSGGLPPVGDDDLTHPAFESLAEEDALRGDVDAAVEGGEEPAELALRDGLGAAHGGVFAAPPGDSLASEVDGEFL